VAALSEKATESRAQSPRVTEDSASASDHGTAGTSTTSAGSSPDRQNAEATKGLIVDAAGTMRSPPSSRPSEVAQVITGG